MSRGIPRLREEIVKRYKRRHNVDLLVESLDRGVHATKPWIRFGVSPIGIWRPGNPPSVTPGSRGPSHTPY